MGSNFLEPSNNSNGKPNGPNGKATRLCAAASRWRSIHMVSGLIVGLWFVMLAITGILVGHQTDLGLTEVEVSNRYLPSHYTTEFSPDTTRLNILLTDLHSGRILGERGGRALNDLAGLLVLISVASGFYAFRLRKKALRLCLEACDIDCLKAESTKLVKQTGQKTMVADQPSASAQSLPQTSTATDTTNKTKTENRPDRELTNVR